MRKHTSAATAALTLFFLVAGTGTAAPWPDAAPGSQGYAEVCPGMPYERVQWVDSTYRIVGDQLTLISQHRIGRPFLIGGYNPRNCHDALAQRVSKPVDRHRGAYRWNRAHRQVADRRNAERDRGVSSAVPEGSVDLS